MSDIFVQVVRDSRSFFRQAAVNAAHELGLFEALADGPRALPSLAEGLSLPPNRLRPLIDVLRFEGALRPGVDPPPRAPLPSEGWGRLADVIRCDRPLRLDDDPAAEERYQRHLTDVGGGPAAALVERFVPADARRLLDAGGGAGAYAAAALRACPELRVALVDRPSVLALAQEHLAPWTPRVRFLAADLLRDPLPRGQDVALLANVLHLYDPQDARRLVQRCAGALRPGGRLLVKDLTLAADRSGPLESLYFALNMALYTEGGDVHDAARIVDWLAAAGLRAITVEPLAAPPATALAVVVSGTQPNRTETDAP